MEQFISIANGYDVITWNITEILKDIGEKDLPVYDYSVEDLCACNDFTGDAEYAMSNVNDEPCVIAKLNEYTEILIDGNHRLYKAKQSGMSKISCYVLPVEFHKKFIVDYNEEIYVKVAAAFI